MGLFNKLKNMFYEEEVEEVNSNDEKGGVKVEEKPNVEEKHFESKKDVENVVSERELFNTEPTFKFPVIFEDEDFSKETEKKSVNVLEVQARKYKDEIKKTPKEENKPFRPSPIISPIYGVLDKNYKKEEISTKDGLLINVYEDETKIDIDSVRKKAYGETITREERNIKNNIEVKDEVVDHKETEINLFADETTEEVETNEYDLDEIDKKIKSIDDLLKETNDEDFYSLVDSMYKDEGDEE